MSIDFFTLDEDEVINGYVSSATSSYSFAIENLIPLIGRLDIQRNTLKTKFYTRLEQDIITGCVMPPITVAFVHSFNAQNLTLADVKSFVTGHLNEAFILDGIQRLNTLRRASTDAHFNPARVLHINFVIASSKDKLLYRMITLNNGQKAMSARHQIEILADTFFEFSDMPLKLVAEKGNGRVRAPETFKKSDFVKGYVAYLSGSVNIDNQKIIEEKMDELIASRIIDSDIPSKKREFSDIVEAVNRFSENSFLRDWIRVQNNFIGFCVGAAETVDTFQTRPLNEIEFSIRNFEQAFDSVNVSKVNIGKVRRELVMQYVKNYQALSNLDEFELLDWLSNWI
ncbi:hypothetical protein BSR09_14950 [Stutzerimonas degradans]|nr:hypothetical protein BSR09_14950 [Stutzerimonas degradans]